MNRVYYRYPSLQSVLRLHLLHVVHLRVVLHTPTLLLFHPPTSGKYPWLSVMHALFLLLHNGQMHPSSVLLPVGPPILPESDHEARYQIGCLLMHEHATLASAGVAFLDTCLRTILPTTTLLAFNVWHSTKCGTK